MSKYTENFPNLSTYDFDTIMCQLKQVCGADPSGMINAQFLSRPTTAKDIALLLHITYQLFQSQVELQKQFVELYTFVKDFFENLDLQEEVNNYLNENAEILLKAIKFYALPESYGAKGDGVTNDTNAFNECISDCENLGYTMFLQSNKNYVVDPLELNDVKLYGNGATLTMPIQPKTNSPILTLHGKSEVYDLSLYGDIESTIEGEWNHGIFVSSGNNVIISNVHCENTKGDAIAVADKSKNTKIIGCDCKNVYRNGISLISCDGVYIDMFKGEDIKGTLPMACIDIEGNSNQDATKNIYIGNIKAKNCNRALSVICRGNEVQAEISSIECSNMNSSPLNIAYSEVNDNAVTENNTKNTVIIGNITISECDYNGISITRWNKIKCPFLLINNIVMNLSEKVDYAMDFLLDRIYTLNSSGNVSIKRLSSNRGNIAFRNNSTQNDRLLNDVFINAFIREYNSRPINSFNKVENVNININGFNNNNASLVNGINVIGGKCILSELSNDFIILCNESSISFNISRKLNGYSVLLNGDAYTEGTNIFNAMGKIFICKLIDNIFNIYFYPYSRVWGTSDIGVFKEPINGDTYFDTVDKKPYWYDGTNWYDSNGTIKS